MPGAKRGKQNVSDDDVKASRERVDNLRKQVRERKTAMVTHANSGTNAHRKDKLDAEGDALQAELDSLDRRIAGKATTKDTADKSKSSPLTAETEEK